MTEVERTGVEFGILAVLVWLAWWYLGEIPLKVAEATVEAVAGTAQATREAVQQTGAGLKDPSIPVTGTEWSDWWKTVSGWFGAKGN